MPGQQAQAHDLTDNFELDRGATPSRHVLCKRLVPRRFGATVYSEEITPMKPSHHLKTALAMVSFACAGLLGLAAPAHAGLLANGSVETLLIADGTNCPGVPLGQSCADGALGSQGKDGLDVGSLFAKSAGLDESNSEARAHAELTVAFPRDAYGSSSSSSADMDAASLSCLSNPYACRDKLYTSGGAGFSGAGFSGAGGAGAGGSGVVAGVASSAFSLGFMQSVAGVQVSPQYGLSFLQGSTPSSAKSGEAAGSSGNDERWQVTYGSSNQPAAAVTSVEGSSGWSSSGLQFQATSATQVETYMASGPSGLVAGGVQITPMNTTPFAAPEPSVLMLVGAAMFGLWLQRRRQGGRP